MGNTPPTKFNKKTTAIEAADNVDLNGKVALVTGCNTGIGKETVRVLAIQGAKVYMLCRNISKAHTARDDIIQSIKPKQNKSFDDNKLIVMEINLSSLLSVRRFVGKFLSLNEPIDYLINNAGVMAIPEFTASTDGYEMQFAINHLGHFYLTILLTPLLLKCTPCRVICLGSSAHRGSPKLDDENNNFIIDGMKRKNGPTYYTAAVKMKGYENYGLSKVCDILFAREYNRRYEKNGIIAVSLHPGVISTQLFQHMNYVAQFFMNIGKVMLKTVQQGAATTIRCVSLGNDEICGGHYYQDCNEANDALRNDIKPNRGKVVQKNIETKVEDNDKEKSDDKLKSGDDDKSEQEIQEKHEENVEEMIRVNKQDVNCVEYKLWEWSELLITEKGFKLDMIGFEEEEKERLKREEKEKVEKEIEKKEEETNDELDGNKKEEEVVEKEKVEKVMGKEDKNEDIKSDKVDEVNVIDDKNKDIEKEEIVKGNDEVVQEDDKEKVKQDGE